MALRPWKQVIESDAYKSLSPEDKQLAGNRYAEKIQKESTFQSVGSEKQRQVLEVLRRPPSQEIQSQPKIPSKLQAIGDKSGVTIKPSVPRETPKEVPTTELELDPETGLFTDSTVPFEPKPFIQDEQERDSLISRATKQFANVAALRDIESARPTTGIAEAVGGITGAISNAKTQEAFELAEQGGALNTLKAFPKLWLGMTAGYFGFGKELAGQGRDAVKVARKTGELESVLPASLEFNLPEAEGIAEKVADGVGGIGGFITKLAIAKKLIPSELAEFPRLATALQWELTNTEGVPGQGALMGLTLHAMGSLKAATNIGKAGIVAGESGLFAGMAAAQGGELEDIIIAASIPVALRGVSGSKRLIKGVKDFKTYNEFTKQARQSALKDLGLSGNPTQSQIKAAFRKKILRVHPDLNTADVDARAAQSAKESLDFLRTGRGTSAKQTLKDFLKGKPLPDIAETGIPKPAVAQIVDGTQQVAEPLPQEPIQQQSIVQPTEPVKPTIAVSETPVIQRAKPKSVFAQAIEKSARPDAAARKKRIGVEVIKPPPSKRPHRAIVGPKRGLAKFVRFLTKMGQGETIAMTEQKLLNKRIKDEARGARIAHIAGRLDSLADRKEIINFAQNNLGGTPLAKIIKRIASKDITLSGKANLIKQINKMAEAQDSQIRRSEFKKELDAFKSNRDVTTAEKQQVAKLINPVAVVSPSKESIIKAEKLLTAAAKDILGQVPAKLINNAQSVMRAAGARKLRDLDADELDTLTKAIRAIATTRARKIEVIGETKKIKQQAVVTQSVKDVKIRLKTGDATAQAVTKINENQKSPRLKKAGGALLSIEANVDAIADDGTVAKAVLNDNLQKASRGRDELRIQDSNTISKWESKAGITEKKRGKLINDKIIVGLKDTGTTLGNKEVKSLDLTQGEIGAIVAIAQDPELKTKILTETDGIRFGKTNEVLKLSAKGLKVIESMADKSIVSLAKDYFKWVNSIRRDQINEVSLRDSGTELASRTDHIGSSVDAEPDTESKVGSGSVIEDFVGRTLDNQAPFLKRTGSKGRPVILTNIFEMIDNYVEISSEYIAKNDAVRDAKSLIQNKEFRDSVFEGRGTGAASTLDNIEFFIREFENTGLRAKQTALEGLVASILGGVQIKAIAAKPAIMAQQLASFGLLPMEIPIKHVAKSIQPKPSKKTRDEIKKWSAPLTLRLSASGRTVISPALGKKRQLRNFESKRSKIDTFNFGGIRLFDSLVIEAAWRAAVSWTKESRPDLKGDKFWEHVADITETAVRRTQPTSDVLSVARLVQEGKSSSLKKAAVMFAGQVQKTPLMMLRAVGDYRRSREADKKEFSESKKTASDKKKFKNNRKKAFASMATKLATIGVLVPSSLWFFRTGTEASFDAIQSSIIGLATGKRPKLKDKKDDLAAEFMWAALERMFGGVLGVGFAMQELIRAHRTVAEKGTLFGTQTRKGAVLGAVDDFVNTTAKTQQAIQEKISDGEVKDSTLDSLLFSASNLASMITKVGLSGLTRRAIKARRQIAPSSKKKKKAKLTLGDDLDTLDTLDTLD